MNGIEVVVDYALGRRVVTKAHLDESELESLIIYKFSQGKTPGVIAEEVGISRKQVSSLKTKIIKQIGLDQFKKEVYRNG